MKPDHHLPENPLHPPTDRKAPQTLITSQIMRDPTSPTNIPCFVQKKTCCLSLSEVIYPWFPKHPSHPTHATPCLPQAPIQINPSQSDPPAPKTPITFPIQSPWLTKHTIHHANNTPIITGSKGGAMNTRPIWWIFFQFHAVLRER